MTPSRCYANWHPEIYTDTGGVIANLALVAPSFKPANLEEHEEVGAAVFRAALDAGRLYVEHGATLSATPITSAPCRAARALIDMDQADLARKAVVWRMRSFFELPTDSRRSRKSAHALGGDDSQDSATIMPFLMPTAADTSEAAHLHILEAYIETLKAENESLKRQLADAEKRVARETAKTAASIAEFSAITRRFTARAAGPASYG